MRTGCRADTASRNRQASRACDLSPLDDEWSACCPAENRRHGIGWVLMWKRYERKLFLSSNEEQNAPAANAHRPAMATLPQSAPPSCALTVSQAWKRAGPCLLPCTA